MSIIEKAVAKLEERSHQGERPVPPVRAESVVDLMASRAAEPVPQARVVEPQPLVASPVDVEVRSLEGRAPVAANAPTGSGGTTLRYENIDLQRLADAGMITPDGDRTAIFEEFRLIKRPLLRNALNQGPTPIRRGNLIMVTSCVPGEGKSFSALNLAMSMAMEMDHTVLLIDADVAKPSVPRMLNIEGGVGLMDVLLEDGLPLSQALIRTNVEKLRILTAGRPHPNATELLASTAMRDLLEDIAQRYSDRIVIFDSPPLLATTEARVLATQMGQVVVVVEAGKTTHQTLREGLHYLESCEVVSLLLNKSRFRAGAGYYGYGGGYGYGYGYGSETHAK